MATPYSLYHKYRTVEGGGGPYQDIDTKHSAFLNWLDNPEGGGIVLSEEGDTLQDHSNIIRKQDPAGMQAAEEYRAARENSGAIGGFLGDILGPGLSAIVSKKIFKVE